MITRQKHTQLTDAEFEALPQPVISYGTELKVAGDSVTRVALELGYEHGSAYIALFKRCLGSTPRRYLQHKH